MDWMSSVSDDVFVSDMSIPGTHQSCALHGLPCVQCQSVSLQEQLSGGIRMFDIRGRCMETGLLIFHQEFYQKCSLSDVLEEFDRFLTSNPREMILMSLKGNEYSPGPSAMPFYDAFRFELDKGGSRFWSRFYSGNTVPKLQEVRGKIILLKRAGAIDAPCGGIDIEDFSDGEHVNSAGVRYAIQDHYNITSIGVDAKMDKVRAQYDWARNHDSLSFNYLNCYSNSWIHLFGLTGTPYHAAQEINRQAHEHVRLNPNAQRKWGITAMDYFGDTPTRELARLLIAGNVQA